jgi:hypothetical protein
MAISLKLGITSHPRKFLPHDPQSPHNEGNPWAMFAVYAYTAFIFINFGVLATLVLLERAPAALSTRVRRTTAHQSGRRRNKGPSVT